MSTILVVAEHRRGEVRAVTLELITAAQQLKTSADDSVLVAVVGAKAESLAAQLQWAGVDEIIACQTSAEEFEPELAEQAISQVMQAHQPAVILLPHSVDSLGYATALAVKGGFGYATDVFKLAYDNGALLATRGGYNQKVNVEVDFPGKACVLLTLRSGVFKPVEEAAAPKLTVENCTALTARSRPLGFIEPANDGDVDITTSDFIVSIGRGIGEEVNVEDFRELAEELDATLCCSRPIADAGWLPKSRQVGQSGKVVSACKLYVAMGISGSIQHMAGMKHVGSIVAVNTDPGASIFTIAKYGIVGDIFDIHEALMEQLA